MNDHQRLGARETYELALKMGSDMSLAKTAGILSPMTDAQVAVALMNLGRLFIASHGYGQPGKAWLGEVDDMAERIDRIYDEMQVAAYSITPAEEITDE